MAYCNNCGNLIPDGAATCQYCGCGQQHNIDIYSTNSAGFIEAKKASDSSTIFIMGLFGLLFSLTGPFLVGIVLSIVGIVRSNTYKLNFGELNGDAKAGRILSIVGLVIGIISVLLIIAIVLLYIAYIVVMIVLVYSSMLSSLMYM